MTKFTVDSKSFAEALQWALKGFDGKDEKAFLALKFTAEGLGEVAHTNPSSYLKATFQVLDKDMGDKEEIVFPLQGQFVARLAGSLEPSGPSELIWKDNVLTLANKGGRFTIPTFKATVKSAPELSSLGEVNTVDFFDAMQRLSKLCDMDSAGFYPTLGTVDLHLDFEEGEATLMATDRYTLGEIKVPFSADASGATLVQDGEGQIRHLLIPHGSATLVNPGKNAYESAELVYEPVSGKFGYSFSDGKIALFALQDAEPLAYQTLKSNASAGLQHSTQVDTKELQKAIGTISNLAWTENDVYFKISEDAFLVEDSHATNSLEIGSEADELGDEHAITFLRPVISKVFSPIGTGKVNIKWSSSTGAFVFEPVKEDGTVADNVFVLAVPVS